MSVNKRGELSNGLPPDDVSGGGDYEPRPVGLDRATELKLIDAALLSDMQAFSQLFEHYRPALYGLCCRRLNDFALAEDVVQEVFLKAFKNLPNSDYRKPIWPWLAAIAHRMCIDLHRRRSLIHYSGDIRLTIDEDSETNGHTESALDSVIASEDRVELWKSLEVLPERQRRAFVLYEVDGLSCADIAAAEGISVGAVKLLLFRARKKLRSLNQSGPLPALVFPLTWLGWKLQRIGERIRIVLGVYSDGFTSACVQAACLGTVVAMVVAASHPIESFEHRDGTFIGGKGSLGAQSQLQTASLQTALLKSGAPTKAPVESQQLVAPPANSLVGGLINPNQSATPEDTNFESIMVSPNYESDYTLVASGIYWTSQSQPRVLFVSNDGGASWKPLLSNLLSRERLYWPKLALSPGYSHARQIFALGDVGLEQSDDGGENFRTVSPLVGSSLQNSLAISPSFGKGDSSVLIGGKTLLEYDAGTGITQPWSLTMPQASSLSYPYVAFSPSYSSDSTLFVSDWAKDTLGPRTDQTSLYRCKRSVCDEMQFPISGLLRLRFSPRFAQDGLVYAFTSYQLLVSNDGGRTFRDLQFPLPDGRSIQDVAILWDTSSNPAILVSAPDWYVLGVPGIYRSLDSGRSWHTTSGIDIPGFQIGAVKLVVTPTGRLFATGGWYGIACSENAAQTWAPRCPPER